MTTTYTISTSRGDFNMRDTHDEIALMGAFTTHDKLNTFGKRLARKFGGSDFRITQSSESQTVEFVYGHNRKGALAVDGRCTVYSVREA